MAQWGRTTTLISGDTRIKVLPHLDTGTDPFSPANSDSIIDDVIVLDIRGDEGIVNGVLEAAKKQYVGKPYSEWPVR